MRFSRPRRRSPRIDVSPLIDVVFQLLLFYAVTTQFVSPEKLKLQLPEARTATAEGAAGKEVEIVVTATGDIVVAGRTVARDRLAVELQGLLKQTPDRTLTIRGDKGANYGTVIFVLDTARAAGARGVNLAAVKP